MTDLLDTEGEQVVAWGLATHSESNVREVDLLDRASVDAQDLSKLDAVIHLAGLAAVGPSFDDPGGYVSANAGMEANLFEALLSQRLYPRVLVVSSGAVYADSAKPLSEESATSPSNPYVISKLTQEMLAGYYARRDFEVIVACPFNHVGAGQQSGFLVADIASQIVDLERCGGGTLRVGNLDTERDYSDVRDVVRAYLDLVRAGIQGETYNVCSA
jgi:GDP-4-dehydro-6-deoxy-D-mannose reductase